MELDEMELVAAAVGYHYLNSVSKRPRCSLSPNGGNYMADLLDGPEDACREMLRMDKQIFH